MKFASEASDIPSDRILSESRDADVVDARMLVIQTLYDIGLYPRRIAEMFGMTPSNVRHLLTANNREATNKIYANNLQALRKHIARSVVERCSTKKEAARYVQPLFGVWWCGLAILESRPTSSQEPRIGLVSY